MLKLPGQTDRGLGSIRGWVVSRRVSRCVRRTGRCRRCGGAAILSGARSATRSFAEPLVRRSLAPEDVSRRRGRGPRWPCRVGVRHLLPRRFPLSLAALAVPGDAVSSALSRSARRGAGRRWQRQRLRSLPEAWQPRRAHRPHAVRSGGVPRATRCGGARAGRCCRCLSALSPAPVGTPRRSRHVALFRSDLVSASISSGRRGHRRRQVALRPAPLSDQRNADRVRSARGLLRGVLSRPPQGRGRGRGGGRPAQRLRAFPGQRHSGAACAVCNDRSALLPHRASLGARAISTAAVRATSSRTV